MAISLVAKQPDALTKNKPRRLTVTQLVNSTDAVRQFTIDGKMFKIKGHRKKLT